MVALVGGAAAGAAAGGALHLVRGGEGAVDLGDERVEEPLVGRLGQGMPSHVRLSRRARHLAAHDDLRAQRACELVECAP
jgi:hypothetical protein